MNKDHFKFVIVFFVLFVIFALNTFLVSAQINLNLSINSSNLGNGTVWLQGGVTRNLTIDVRAITGNATTNITNINITTTNLTFNGVLSPATYNTTINSTGWNCTVVTTTWVNCSAVATSQALGTLSSVINVSVTLPSTAAEINHSITVLVADNFTVTNTSRWNFEVDGVSPTITLPDYTNGTAKKNSTTLTLNLSVIDAGSGMTGFCFVDVNGSNQTLSFSSGSGNSSGWCNGTVGLSGLVDGNKTINISFNDTTNNMIRNGTFVVNTDTTVPTPSPSCSPASVNVGDTFPCSCSGSDASSGINSSATASSSTSPDGTATPSNTGAFTYTCSVTDRAGNLASDTATYSVSLVGSSSSSSSSGGSSSSSSGGGDTITWTNTYTVSAEQFSAGYSKELAANNRMKFKVETENHSVGVKELSSTSATIIVESETQEVAISVGETKKFEVSGDNYYDIKVTLESIADNKANLTVQSISELMPEEAQGTQQPSNGEDTNTAGEEGNNLIWYVLIGIVILVVITIAIVKNRRH